LLNDKLPETEIDGQQDRLMHRTRQIREVPIPMVNMKQYKQ
jgi:hypothetical protein